MNIAFVVNENYAIYLYVAVVSILRNKNKDDQIHFFVFNPNLSEKSKNEILKLKKKHNFEIEFISINEENELVDFPLWKAHNSKLAHYRFKIAQYMQNKGIRKFLYSDCDIIVNSSISELYNTDLGDKALGLVPCGHGDEEKEFIPKLSLAKDHKYTYSGLMLVDVDNFVNQKMLDKIIFIAHEKGESLHWPDMDLLNLACNGNNYKELHPKYSINPGFKGFCTFEDFLGAFEGVYDNETVREAYYNPVIWQLAGGAKPNSPIALDNIKELFYQYSKGSIWQREAKKWLPKSIFCKLFKEIGKFFWRKKTTIIDDIEIKKYKIFGISVYKKYKSIPEGMQLLNIKETDRCLCMCPHADDETIGLGGLLLKYSKNFDVLCVNSSGVAYKELSAKERSDIRISEFNSVMDTIGVNKYWIFEGYGTPPMFEQIDNHFADYLNVIDLKEYDYIFIPYMNDAHPEHQYLTKNVFPKLYKVQGLKKDAKIIMYEVWTPIERVNCVVDIKDVIDEKIKVLKMYKSQIGDGWDYDRWTRSLNSYRSMQAMGLVQTEFAEAFVKQSARRFIENIGKGK